MALTPHSQLQQWLVLVLADLGGAASRAQALNAIEDRFADAFTEEDLEQVPSRPWEPKWRNGVSWQRDDMVKAGLLEPYKGHGTPWTLTDEGWGLHAELADTVPPSDPFAHFKPKSSAEYMSHVADLTLMKQRSHEELIADFGTWAISQGLYAATDVHPRDLIVTNDDAEWLVEAKVVYVGNATQAVRAATAQLLMYRYLLYRTASPMLLALCFSEDIGQVYVDFLESLKIASAWREDDGWRFSPRAMPLAG
jgi:hypothetical protein